MSECRSCCWHSRYRNEVCSFRRVCRVVRNTVPPTFSRTHFPLFPPVGLMTEPLPTPCDAVPPGSVVLAVADEALSPASLSLLLLLLLLLLLWWWQPRCVDSAAKSVGSRWSSAVVAIWKKPLKTKRGRPSASACLPPRYCFSLSVQDRARSAPNLHKPKDQPRVVTGNHTQYIRLTSK